MKVACVVPAYNEEARIGRTLEALNCQSDPIPDVVVVDNGSTDHTREIVEEFASVSSALSDQTIHYVREPRKGTGIACNTGFNYAIDVLGAEVVSRTDADTIPSQAWNLVIKNYFEANPNKLLIGGRTLPINDKDKRLHDGLLLSRPSFATYRLGMALVAGSYYPLRIAIGHNMAVRSDIFKQVGGFVDGSIEETDEDVELTKSIHKEVGLRALGYSKDMKVYTSMRRVRAMGYLGVIRSYINPSVPVPTDFRLSATNGNYDIR